MPERNIEFGKYGARGIKGHEAVARQLDALAGYIATPITARRGLQARMHYLTRTLRARTAARAAGLTVTDRTLRVWTAAPAAPRGRTWRRSSRPTAPCVGRTSPATWLPASTATAAAPQSQGSRPRQRPVEFRALNVRRWDRIVAAWAAGDDQALDDASVDLVVDFGSQWGQYEYVTNVGFAA